MSSCYDAGKAAAAAREVRESKCPKSPDGKHKWKHHFPESPSAWGECKYCGDTYYDK